MTYMVYQRYTTAIVDAYKDHPEVPHHFEEAQSHRRWLQSLDIDNTVKNTLVEQAQTIEAAFERLNTPLANLDSTRT